MADPVEVKFGAETGDLDKGTDKAVQDMEKFGQSIIDVHAKLDQLAQSTTSDMAKVGQAIASPQRAMDQTSAKAMGMADVLKTAAAGLAAAFSVRAMIGWAQSTAAATEKLSNLSQQIGISVGDLSALEVVSKNAGLGADGFTTAIQAMDRNLASAKEGSEEQSAAFKALGIDVNTAKGNMDLMLQIAAKFSHMPDGPEKTALAMKLLGRSGAELIPIFNKGEDAIVTAMTEAEKSGAAMSETMVAVGLKVDDAFDSVDNSVTTLSNNMFEQLGPAIADIASGFSNWLNDMKGGGHEVTVFNDLVVALNVTLKALGVIGGAIGVIITDVVVAATIVAITAISLLRATVISLAKALTGDFSGALSTWTSETDNAVKAVESQIDHARKIQQDYGQFLKTLKDDKPTATGVSGAPGAQPDAKGQAVLDAIAAHQAEVAKKAADAELRQQQAAAQAKIREAQRVAREIAASQIEGIQNEQDALQDDFAKWMDLEEKKLEILKKTYGEDSRQFKQAIGEKEAAERAHQKELDQIRVSGAQADRAVAQIRVNSQRDAARAGLDIERERIANMAALGQIDANQAIAMTQAVNDKEYELDRQLEEKIYALKLAGLRDQLSVSGLSLQDKAKINAEIEQAEAEHQARMLALTTGHTGQVAQANNAAAQAAQQSWLSITQPVAGALGGMFQSLYNGTANFRDSLLQAMDQILIGFVNMGLQMAAQWAANELAKTAATAAGVAARTGAEEAGAATTTSISAATALAQIANYAWTAAAGAFAAMAGIPVIGPVLAVSASAAALGAVLAFAGSIFSAEGGWGKVPKGGAITKLHEDEMVLPSTYASPLRDMLAGWGPKSSPGSLGSSTATAAQEAARQRGGTVNEGDTILNYAPQSNVNNVTLDQLLRRDGNAMKRWLDNETRNGKLAPGRMKRNS